MTEPVLRALVDLRDRQIQKARIQFSNRLSAIDRQTDDSNGSGQRTVVERWLEVFTELEKKLDKDIGLFVKDMPIYQEMSQVKGVGPLLSAKMLAMIDIEVPQSVSALWQYCGYGQEEYWVNEKDETVAPVTGMQWVKVTKDNMEILKSFGQDMVTGDTIHDRSEKHGPKFLVRYSPQPKPEWQTKRMISRPVSDWMLSYNKRLKTSLYTLAGSFLKSRSPYAGIYANYKEEYARKHSDWTKLHLHLASNRKMIKIFLSHFWTRWRTLEGLPVTEPYVFRVLGHSKNDFYPSEDFGWSE